MNPIMTSPNITNTLKIGIVANILEWYEFSVYGYLVGIIGQQFFNTTDEVIAVILAFSIFSMSYLIRPLGSIFFGYLGDKYGLHRSLKHSLLMMSIPTCFIGLLPGYDNIGAFAPVLLCALRIIQGFAAGGELPSSACYVYEHSNSHHRGWLCSSVSASSLTGVLLGSLTVTLLSLFFGQEYMSAWGWRIPFLMGLPLTIVIFYLRRNLHVNLEESSQQADTKKSEFNRLGQLNNIFAMMQAFFLVAFLQVYFYVLFIWMPTYLEYFLHISANISHLSNTLTLIALAIFTLLFGFLSRYFNRRQIILLSIISSVLLSYPLFALLPKGTFLIVVIVQFIFALSIGAMNGVTMETLGNLFPKNIRCSSFSISFSSASTFFGGTAPAICSYFVHKTGILLFPAFYMVLFGLLAFPFAVRLKG